MNWLIITLFSYFLLAIVGIVDKFLLSKVIPDNRLYTFLIGFLGIFVFFAAPFVPISWPGFSGFIIDIASGACLIGALFLFYKALRDADASIVIPLIGGGIPILVFILSVLFLDGGFTNRQLVALLLLLIGGILITFIPKEKRHWWQMWKRTKPSGIGTAVASATFFSVFFVLSEYSYTTQGFATGFILSRLGSFMAVAWLLFDTSFQKTLRRFFRHFVTERKYFFFFNQLFGAVGFFGQSYAISLKNAALVNALQGVQYVCLLLIASLVSLFFPQIIKERATKIIIAEKTIAVAVIAAGVYLITT